MTRRSILVGLAVLASAVSLTLLAWPVQAQVDEATISCGVAAPWVIYVAGYDPTGPTDPPATYAEFRACRDSATPLVVGGVPGVAVTVALTAAAFRMNRVERAATQ